VQNAAQSVERLFPLSLASEGSARIGGLMSTNAGGVNVLRYGNARDLCLGIEAVMPDGSVYHGLRRMRKDNTGYDLRHLMIGAEGTLGIITAASLRLFPRPVAEGAALIVVPGPEAALKLLSLAGEHLGQGVSAFEIMHRMGLDFLSEKMPEVRQPFAEKPEWMVLIDVGLGRGVDVTQALETLFEQAANEGLALDGVIAQSQAQRAEFWAIRENIPEANRRIGSVSSHDISMPLGAIPDFIRKGGEVIAEIGDFRINCFGHVGDGNLHYNVFPMPGQQRADHENERPAIKRAIHDLVHSFDGSVSAEHGIGRLKVDDLKRYGDPAKLAAMRAIKDALDPKGIMNPGAVVPPA
jgi:FAD/FMN-containing dehydrogenase